MHRNKSVDTHSFAMVPRSEIPRSSFRIQKTLKTTFDAGVLVPIYVDEILPGDSFNVRMTAFARLSTPIFPIMDNLHLDTFFFFVPCRLVWTNWVKFMGEQVNPADSISYSIPQVASAVGGFVVGSVYDYMGLPTVGQVAGGSAVSVNALPLRAYNLIYNTWFRDENLVNSQGVPTGDGPDPVGTYALVSRGKRHDYFTSCLPWPQKGGVSATIPLTGDALVRTRVGENAGMSGANPAGSGIGISFRFSSGGGVPTADRTIGIGAANPQMSALGSTAAVTHNAGVLYPTNLYADLTSVTAVTINQLRQSFQVQRLLERDARGGTRYTEIVRSHFGVISPDARLQRPEYLGGGSTPIEISPVAQTSNSAAGVTPQGNLSAFGTALGKHGWSQSFTEHGYVIGLANVRADLTYQQGLRKLWSRGTRYDFYFPVFSHLGEQAVLNKEIYCQGVAADDQVFGYQARWDEYRYNPSQITGLFRSTSAGTIDPWHLAQRFTALPTLNDTFIRENPPLSRVLAVGAGANGQQILLDAFFDAHAARPLPMYGTPGLIDHF